jgi:hypothetical protein
VIGRFTTKKLHNFAESIFVEDSVSLFCSDCLTFGHGCFDNFNNFKFDSYFKFYVISLSFDISSKFIKLESF